MIHFKQKYTALLLFLLPLFSYSQKVENVHFEQVGKQIHIYYDLEGEDIYNVAVFCSTNNGKTWGEPLQKVSGDAGENIKSGKDKEVVWDVLKERERLSGNISFKIEAKPENKGTFTDSRDGQTYKWVKIGTQIWMAENLKYLPAVSPSSEGSHFDPLYYVYDYRGNSMSVAKATANFNTYGVLYNWPAAMKACPSGWHLPSDDEWKTLEMYLGMSQSEADKTEWRGTDEGKQMKSTSGWSENGNGTNSSGFNALPGGTRVYTGQFNNLGGYGFWWSATENGNSAWSRSLVHVNDLVYRKNGNKSFGYSVRCVRD
jgi:uncharacterized protein (TIGR02145 family)